jgi:NDP-sugar pyrophosphorylase family protein
MDLPSLFDDVPEPFAASLASVEPWSALGEPLDAVLVALPSDGLEIRVSPDVHLVGDRIAVGRGTRLGPGVTLEGPVWIGRDVVVRAGAYVRAGCWLGDGCVVGANTEVKRSILLPGAKAPHLAYVGDSVLGQDVNLGAGVVLSNFRHDGREIEIPLGEGRLSTGRRKLGAVLGDRVRVGCNAVLHPGAVVGRETEIYPGVQLRAGVYAERSIIKLRQSIDIVARHEP